MKRELKKSFFRALRESLSGSMFMAKVLGKKEFEMSTWQPLPPNIGQKILDALKIVLRAPLIVVLMAFAFAGGSILVALIIKATIKIFRDVVFRPW